MLFIVPDEPDETLDLPAQDDDTGDSSSPKAALDDAETTKSSQKVDLDLDDAPFLEEEEEEEELFEEEQVELPAELDETEEKKGVLALLKNKFVIIGGVSVLALGLLAFFLLGGEDAPQTPVPEEVEIEQEQPAEEPVQEEIQETPGETLVKLDPFIVEQRDAEGTLRFLEISLVFSTSEQMLADNLVRETPSVRYALFYYLRNKDLAFLTDQDNVDNLKKELLAVTNQYMATGQFETLLFEQYLVK